MRKVNKDFNAPPPALQQGFEEKKNDLLARQSAHHFDPLIYNNAAKQELKDLYHRKCAYCESFMSDDDFTAEHYRPKKGDYSYYWLGYEWSNLLPVCQKCNNRKGDRFPVEVPSRVSPNSFKKTRVRNPRILLNGELDIQAMKAEHPYLLDEKPYLLHPEIDEPKEYLSVRITGELASQIEKEVNGYRYKRVEETINLTNLNRQILIWKRRKIIQDFENLIIKKTNRALKFLTDRIFKFLTENDNQRYMDLIIELVLFDLFENIEEQFKEDQEYTLTVWWTWKNIKEMLFKPICNDNKEVEKMLNYALDLYEKLKHKKI